MASENKQGAQQAVSPDERSHWWALVMGAAAEIEQAENCLRDPDAKRTAASGAAHYREQAQKLFAAAPEQPAPVKGKRHTCDHPLCMVCGNGDQP